MRRRSVIVLLMLLSACHVLAEEPAPLFEELGTPAIVSTQEPRPCWDWLTGQSCQPITAGDPDLKQDFWQRTWGLASLDVIPVGRKMAPNGVPYAPLFSLELLLNVALTAERDVYFFGQSRFWAQKPGVGITNANQGVFDFSKRQYDLDAGLAWNFYGRFEGRTFLYSNNNLNRGSSSSRPSGYKDGYGVECRYYLPNANFDRGLYRYLGMGYYPTKHQIGGVGDEFRPGFFVAAHVAYDVIPERGYLYADVDLIHKRDLIPKLLIVDPGLAVRPFRAWNDVEMRVGVESTIDMDVGYTRSFLYTTMRFVW